MELDDILNVLATSSDDERVEAIRDAVRAAAEQGADMPSLEAAAVDRFRELTDAAQESVPSEDQLTALECLVDVVEQLRSYNVDRASQAEEARQRLSSLASRVVTGEDESDTDEGGDGSFADSSEDEEDEEDGEGGEEGEKPWEKNKKKMGASKGAAVASRRSSTTAQDRKLPLQFLRSKSPAGSGGRGTSRFASGDDRGVRYSVTSADVPGISARQKIGDMGHLATVVNTRMQSMVRSATSGRAGIATITRQVAAKYSISQEMDIDGAIKAAADEFALPGGNLVAAGAWCAPPETLWDLCPDDQGTDGFLDLPTVTTRRSGIRFPQAFDFSSLYGGVGFHFGKDQLHWKDCETGPEFKKCCIEIPCPEWTECLLELDGICIRNSILMERGWPEWTADFTARVLKAHNRRMNAWTIAKVESLATQISMPQVDLPNTGVDVAGLHGPGAVESVLSILEMMVEYQRYKYRLPRNATLEAVMPYWLLPILRADLSKKDGWDANRWNVSDAQLISFLQSRGVRVQFVYDWQDAFSAAFQPNNGDCPPGCGCPSENPSHGKAKYPHSPGVYDCCPCPTPDPANPCGNKQVRSANEGRVLPESSCCAAGVYEGGDCCDAKFNCLKPLQLGCDSFCGTNAGPLFGGLPPSHWPTHVKILLYPAGSVFKLQQDVITLEGIYDHASLMENKYTSLFTEEGIQVCKRCYDPYLLDIPLCPNGLSGGNVVVGCKPCECTPGYGPSDCNDCQNAFTDASAAFDAAQVRPGISPCSTEPAP